MANTPEVTIHERLKKPAKIIEHKFEIYWPWLVFLLSIHLIAIYGAYLLLTRSIGGLRDLCLNLYFIIANIFCMFGIIAGAHRLWSHRSYKARWPLRLFLATLQTATIQEDIYEWSLKHRVHHKYSDTDADPSNASRGFIWSHIGWLFFKRHPAFLAKVKTIDTTDLLVDPIVRYQRKFYALLVALIRGVMFTGIPYYLFGESVQYLFLLNILFYVVLLHYTWLVNSVAHLYGYRPYDQHIEPTDNSALVYLAMGGGYHNYHHAFPHDYSGSEYGWEQNFNPTTLFIDLFAKIGWAYDRRKISDFVIKKRIERTGDRDNSPSHFNIWLDVLLGLIILFWPLFFIYGVRLIRQMIV